MDQQEEHATLNDFLFEVDDNEQVGRVNVSELTNDDYEDGEGGVPPIREVSIQSIFPDILGQEMERSQTTQSQQSASLQEPLLPQNNR